MRQEEGLFERKKEPAQEGNILKEGRGGISKKRVC